MSNDVFRSPKLMSSALDGPKKKNSRNNNSSSVSSTNEDKSLPMIHILRPYFKERFFRGYITFANNKTQFELSVYILRIHCIKEIETI